MKLRQDEQDRQKILDGLTDVNYGPKQSDLICRRQDGTGQWLLDAPEFKTWVENNNQTLFCPGILGAGKTILTSIVIEDLCNSFYKSSTVGIAYIYCDFLLEDKQKINGLLESLLKQLAQGQTPLPGSVKDLYDRHEAKYTRPSLDEISRALHSVAAIYSRLFIIVDGLDECRCWETLLPEIFNLQAQCRANLFATSRFNLEIIDKFKSSVSLEIRASREDVRRYVQGHMGQLLSVVRENQSLQEEIMTGIPDAVDGMYVLKLMIERSIFTDFPQVSLSRDLSQFTYRQDKSNARQALTEPVPETKSGIKRGREA